MLQSMRKGILKMVLLGFIFLGSMGLVLMDVQGNFRKGVHGNNIAKIGGNKLTAAEFDNIVEMMIRQHNMTRADAYRSGLIRQILDQEVFSRSLLLAAHDMGLVIDDVTAAKEIRKMVSNFAMQTKQSDSAALQQMLQATGMSEGALVAEVKSQLVKDELVDMIVSGAATSQQMVNDATKYRYENRRADYFTLTAADAPAVAAPSDDEIKSYYDSVSSQYMDPEYRNIAVLVLDRKSLTTGTAAAPSDDETRKYYDENIANYTTPDSRSVEEIQTTDEALAKDILAKMGSSKNLETATKEYGKGLADFAKKTYSEKDVAADKEFAEALFKTKDGDMIGPVKTTVGFKIVHVLKSVSAHVVKYEDAKADIAKDLQTRKHDEALENAAEKADDLIAGGSSLADVAKEFGLKEVAIGDIDAKGAPKTGNTTPALPAYDKIVAQAFRLDKDEVSQLIEAPTGEYVIVENRGITPSKPKPLDTIRGLLVDAWKKQKLVAALDAKADKITERLKLGESFDKIAAEAGKKVETTGLIERTADSSKLSRSAITALFSFDRTGDATSVSSDDSVTVLRLAERKVMMPKEVKKEDTEGLKESLDRAAKSDIVEQYKSSLVRKYDISINEDLFNSLYSPKADDSSSSN